MTIKIDSWEKNGIKSNLANIIVAPEDYTEGKITFFTWDEAMKLSEKIGEGWRLPTSEEMRLLQKEFGETIFNDLNFSLNGCSYDDKLYEKGEVGIYWTSTIEKDDERATVLVFNTQLHDHELSKKSTRRAMSVRLVKSIC